MNQTQIAPREPSGLSDDGEISFIDLLIILAKHKRLILVFPIAVALIAAAITFALPDVYRASTKLLPPQQAQSGAAALLSQLGGVAGIAAGAAGLKSPNDIYVAMLTSRNVGNKLVDKFNLKKVYETESLEKARKLLADDTAIISGKDGLIVIEVQGKNQKLVARVANAYVDELLKLTRVLAVTSAGQRRMFFEQQLEQTKNKLAATEVLLKSVMSKHGVISVDAESRAIVETIGRLRAQASAKEIQLASMRAFVTPSNPEFKRVEEELFSLRAELSRLENGRTMPTDQLQPNQKGLANIQLLRDVKYHQMLYELLAKQYEMARLDEANDPSIIQVLDPAVDPERKFKPQRIIVVLLSSIIALFAAIFVAFSIEVKQRSMKLPGGAAKWAELKAHL